MRFQEHWKSELDFDFHVASLNNESYIARNWLKELVGQTVHNSSKGVLITADMGFGKSSFISNLVCAEKWSSWYDLRQQILAYHFCRHDMAMSVTAHPFLLNFAGAIVKQIPEMGYEIIYDEIASKFLYGVDCAKNTVACLEAILHPLRNLWNDRQFLIIIDGLDECDTGAPNNLLELLYSQIHAFPPNVKFVLTSRNIENIYKKFPEMSLLYINASNENNLEDIRQYIQKTTYLSDQQIKTLTLTASGNFQHVKHYIQSCEGERCDFTRIPESLEKLYQLNFERIFKGNNDLYNDLIRLLEVLCTLQNPLSEDELILKAQLNTVEKRSKLALLLENELGHFIKREGNKVSFLHKSTIDFLTDQSRRHLKFFIHKENGHKLFADYLFKVYNISTTTELPKMRNIAELVHHVSMSNNSAYESVLFQYLKILSHKDTLLPKTLLYQVVHDYNNYHTVDLLLSYTNFKDVDARDVRSYSMAFVAAEQGNHESLKCLLDRGASSSFRVTFDAVINFSGTDLVRMCKYIYFCGYNILHIAAQNGHTKVVEVLLERQESLAYLETDMHLNAFHLAAENGYYDILNTFLKRNTSFADNHALFQASKNGHIKVVQVLISHGTTDFCLPCNEKMYWISKMYYRKQHVDHYLSFEVNFKRSSIWPKETYFVDDWRLITCETALNAAIRNGHFQIVQLLTQEKINALNCTTFDGKKPLMTAVQHNRTDIFKYLYRHYDILSLTCKHSTRVTDTSFLAELDISEKVELTAEMCPSGATLAHLVAIYNNIDIVLFMHKSGISKWYNNTTNHLPYTFCNNVYFVTFLSQTTGLNFTVQSVNDFKSFHSGAYCLSADLYFFAVNGIYNLDTSNALGYDGRSILHESMTLPLNEDYLIGNNNTADHWTIMAIFRLCSNSKHYFFRTDQDGRNFLHYAANSGNYYGFIYSQHFLSAEDFGMLLQQKDKTGKTPFDELFSAMPKHETFDVKFCDMLEMFHIDRTLIFSSHEMCVLAIAEFLVRRERFADHSIVNLISKPILKPSLYSVVILKSYAYKVFELIIKNNPDILNDLTLCEQKRFG